MFRTTLATIATHKLRLLSTSIAIVVGVAFVTGTLILSDTLRNTFAELFSQTTAGVDVAVRGPEDTADPFTGRRDGIPTTLVDQIAAVEGVAVVAPEVEGSAQLIAADGEPIGGGAGPPTLGFSTPADPALETPQLREGAFPVRPGEIAIDVGTAEAQGIAVGDPVDVVIDGPLESMTVTGLVGVGDLDNLAGATLVLLDTQTAFERWGEEGYQTIYVIAVDGVDPIALRNDVAAAVGEGLAVESGAELADSQAAGVGEALGFFTTGLLVFAGVSLFVGAFLIANTFSIIVAQRTRELALLRAVGASRRQVLGSVLGEALATGIIGSLLGFAAGVGIAEGLYILLDAFGISLPQGALVVRPSTFAVAVGLGTILTCVVALVPAVRGSRVPPVTALQAVAAPPPPRYGILRYLAGGLVFVAGIAGLALSLTNGGELAVVGGAAAVTLIGASFLAPLVTRPLLRLLGAPISAGRGIQGQLANENALRNPRRTAATASALMIGLALVAFIQILATSFTTSAEAAIDESFAGDFQIGAGFGPPGEGPGPDLEAAIGGVDGVAVATTQRFGIAEVDGSEEFIAAFDGEELSEVLSLEYVEGDLGGFIVDGVAVSDDVAEDAGVSLGDVVTVTVDGETTELTIGAITAANPITGGWLLENGAVPGGLDALRFGGIFVALEEGADVPGARSGVEAVLEAYPTLALQDLTEVKAQITSAIGQLLGLVSALLGLSVVVALFGIVNTLGLSVFERTRELGLLRAVGATRSQVRSMIRWEAVLIAILGAVFGLVIGVLFAWIVITALTDEGVLQLTIPVLPLVGGMVAAALAGVVAAIIPARRASRVDVLRALEAA